LLLNECVGIAMTERLTEIDLNKEIGGVIDTQPFGKELNRVRVIFWETRYGMFSTKEQYTLEILDE
jgi:hypothetical protein